MLRNRLMVTLFTHWRLLAPIALATMIVLQPLHPPDPCLPRFLSGLCPI